MEHRLSPKAIAIPCGAAALALSAWTVWGNTALTVTPVPGGGEGGPDIWVLVQPGLVVAGDVVDRGDLHRLLDKVQGGLNRRPGPAAPPRRAVRPEPGAAPPVRRRSLHPGELPEHEPRTYKHQKNTEPPVLPGLYDKAGAKIIPNHGGVEGEQQQNAEVPQAVQVLPPGHVSRRSSTTTTSGRSLNRRGQLLLPWNGTLRGSFCGGGPKSCWCPLFGERPWKDVVPPLPPDEVPKSPADQGGGPPEGVPADGEIGVGQPHQGDGVSGRGNVKLLKLLAGTGPDITVITGDLVDSRHTDVKTALDFVKEAVKIAPVHTSPARKNPRAM